MVLGIFLLACIGSKRKGKKDNNNGYPTIPVQRFSGHQSHE